MLIVDYTYTGCMSWLDQMLAVYAPAVEVGSMPEESA